MHCAPSMIVSYFLKISVGLKLFIFDSRFVHLPNFVVQCCSKGNPTQVGQQEPCCSFVYWVERVKTASNI